MVYIVSYDIYDNKRRYIIDKILKGFGIRVQYSVFECDITTAQFYKLRNKLYSVIEPAESDNIRIYSICKACYDKLECIGEGLKIENEEYYLL